MLYFWYFFEKHPIDFLLDGLVVMVCTVDFDSRIPPEFSFRWISLCVLLRYNNEMILIRIGYFSFTIEHLFILYFSQLFLILNERKSAFYTTLDSQAEYFILHTFFSSETRGKLHFFSCFSVF